MLTLSKVTRSEMGAYMCIASNGVPPTVSKRMKLQVHCEYMPHNPFQASRTLIYTVPEILTTYRHVLLHPMQQELIFSIDSINR